MRNTKSAFTLVELIVVITILAILGTIAFISLQGYSADARNSKRTSDLNNITSSLNIKLTTGMGVMSAIADSTSALASVDLAGWTGTTSSTVYDAGKVNYSALWMKASEFQDPYGDDYVAWATTLAGGAFQLAASVESDAGEVAKVTGTFNPRAASDVTITATTVENQALVTLASSSSVGFFKVGDILTQGVISKISADGMNITLTTPVSATGATAIALANLESAGLIDDVDNSWTPIEEGEAELPY